LWKLLYISEWLKPQLGFLDCTAIRLDFIIFFNVVGNPRLIYIQPTVNICWLYYLKTTKGEIMKNSSMSEYTLVHVLDKERPNDVLLVTKNNSSALSGKLNLIGNKVEPDEEPEAAAIAAFKSETGYVNYNKLTYFGRIEKYNSKTYCFVMDADTFSQNKTQTTKMGEPVEWYNITEALADKKLNMDLKIIIPLLHCGLKNWALISDNTNIHIRLNQL